MAVIKAVSSKAGIGQALDYVTKEEKTEDKLVSGLHCEPDTVKDEMQATKELWGKTGGRTYKHFVHSYHEDEHITPEQAHKNAIELAKGTEAWKGHEVLIATHIDRGHIHTHFIVNSVNFEDGHKLQWSKADLQNLKDRCNEQSRQQGLHVPEKGKTFSGEEREETVAWNKETYNLLKQAEKGEVKSYVQDTALAVMDCRETATSREDFIDQMKARGYGVDWQDSHKYITFTDLERQSQGEKQCKVRNNKLEKYYAVDFGKESLEHGFEINARREAERTATTERARQQLDRTAVAENSGADERARARQLLDRTAVTEDSRTGKAYQPDNTAVTEERLSNLPVSEILRILKYSLVTNRRLCYNIMFSGIIGAATLTMAWFVQPVLMKLETPTSYYGVIWTVLNLTVGLSALYSDRVERYFGMRKSNTFILLVIIGGYISLAYNLTYWGLAILFIFYIVRGFATPILKGYINQMTFSEMRATVLSIRNFVIRLIFAAIAPFIGWLNDFYSLHVALLVSAGIIAIPGILFLVLQFRKAD